MTDEDFAAEGSLLTYTTVHVARPGIAAPYTLGQVRLADRGPVVFGHIRGLAESVQLPTTVVVRVDTAATPWYWFQLMSDQRTLR
jgi:uncharacterized OB-fold protein